MSFWHKYRQSFTCGCVRLSFGWQNLGICDGCTQMPVCRPVLYTYTTCILHTGRPTLLYCVLHINLIPGALSRIQLYCPSGLITHWGWDISAKKTVVILAFLLLMPCFHDNTSQTVRIRTLRVMFLWQRNWINSGRRLCLITVVMIHYLYLSFSVGRVWKHTRQTITFVSISAICIQCIMIRTTVCALSSFICII
jgi:hypothetical protein